MWCVNCCCSFLPNNCWITDSCHVLLTAQLTRFNWNVIDLSYYFVCLNMRQINHKLNVKLKWINESVCAQIQKWRKFEGEKKHTHNKRQRMRRRQENDKHETSCRYAHFLKQNNNRKKTSKINTKGRRMLGTQRVNIKMKNIWIYSFICSHRARTYYISRYLCRASVLLPHTFNARAHTHKINTTEND